MNHQSRLVSEAIMEAHAKNHTLLNVPRGWIESIDPSTDEVFYTNSHTGAKVNLQFGFLYVSLTGFLVTMKPNLQPNSRPQEHFARMNLSQKEFRFRSIFLTHKRKFRIFVVY